MALGQERAVHARTLASLEQATAHRSQLERELQQLSGNPQLVTRVNDAAAAAVEDVRQLQSKAQDAILQVEEVCRERDAALSQIGGLMRALSEGQSRMIESDAKVRNIQRSEASLHAATTEACHVQASLQAQVEELRDIAARCEAAR